MNTSESPGVAGTGVPQVARNVGRRALKHVATPVLAAGRASGLFGLAKGFVHADEALESLDSATVRAIELDLSEPRRSLNALGTGDPAPALSPVTARATLFDDTGGRLSFRQNVVVDSHERIVFPRATDEAGRPFTFRDVRPWRSPLEEPRRLSGSIAYLSDTGVHNFGHWLLFVFPLVEFYREYLGGDPEYYYVGRPIQSWHYESLADLGIAPERVLTDAVVGGRNLAVIADSVIPPPTRFVNFTTETLRLAGDSTNARHRIYISRRLRPTRSILNEDECLGVLERHGFRSYCTENLTLREERELFANAEAVVALHGAGVANLLFCHARCTVVELFAHGFTSTWFAEASAVLGLTYASLHGTPTKARGLQRKNHPVLIDTRELDTVLAAATRAAAIRQHDDAGTD
jgi:capsular polysaccharide biosynthesis protein